MFILRYSNYELTLYLLLSPLYCSYINVVALFIFSPTWIRNDFLIKLSRIVMPAFHVNCHEIL